jgi:general secretion pathway protein N
MSWRTLRWWLIGFVAYLSFLLATFPVGYALAWVKKYLPEVQLANVSGSIWSGGAQELAIHGQSWGQLQWQFDWRAPFSGHLGYRLQLHADHTQLRARIAGSHDRLLLQDVRGYIPVTQLQTWLPIPDGSLSGTLDMTLKQVVLVKQRPISADGLLDLTGVSLNWPQSIVLGSYQLKLLTQTRRGIHGDITDTGGPLVVQGSLDLMPNGQYEVSGTLTSRDPNNAVLTNLLSYLPANGSGQHTFSFGGHW